MKAREKACIVSCVDSCHFVEVKENCHTMSQLDLSFDYGLGH
jgi:hypothetical protein